MIWYLEQLNKFKADSDLCQSDGTDTKQTIYVHCWRGGMRSGSIAWLFEIYGYKVFTLKNGYKSFRNLVLEEFKKERKIKII